MRLPKATLSLSLKILAFIGELSSRNILATRKVIIDYLKKTEPYIIGSLELLLFLNIIYECEDGIGITKENYSKINESIIKSKKLIVSSLINFQPFVEYSYFFGKKYKPLECARLVKVIYNIEQDEQVIISIFNDWIKFSGIDFEVEPINNKTISDLVDSIENNLKINKFLRQQFNNYYSQISPLVLNDLMLAINNIQINAGQSVVYAGTAVEDFLRMDLAPEINLTKCDGIVQISNELNKQPLKFPTKLNNLSSAVGNFRSMGRAHGVDKKILERWDITSTAAISNILLSILIINAYLTFKEKAILII